MYILYLCEKCVSILVKTVYLYMRENRQLHVLYYNIIIESAFKEIHSLNKICIINSYDNHKKSSEPIIFES